MLSKHCLNGQDELVYFQMYNVGTVTMCQFVNNDADEHIVL